MMRSQTGGCQCGEIRYEITAEPHTIYVCHCTDCQRQSSSAFGMSMSVARDAFKITKGAPNTWRTVTDSGREKICKFCGECGTRLYHEPARNKAIYNIKPGTLDDTSWLAPAAHLWTQSAQPWVPLPDDGNMLSYDTQPADFQPIFDKYQSNDS